jgi:Holliday junction resolvasome RuvABC endonuclease subunit
MGLDPSMGCTGIAYPDNTTQTLKTPDNVTGDGRLVYFADHVLLAARTCGADLVVCEDVPSHMIGAAGKVIPMLHGALRLELMREGITYMVLSPSTLKKFATGSGSADKTAMAMAAYKRFGQEFGTSDECDAAWLRWAGHFAYRVPPIPFTLPAVQVTALHRNVKGGPIAWPLLKGILEAQPPAS